MQPLTAPLVLGEAFRLDPALQAIGAVCQIHTRVKHQIATLALHADFLVWVQSGTKTVRHARGRHRCPAGSLPMLSRDTVWDVMNDPLPQRSYQACAIQLAPETVAEFQASYPALAGAARAPLASVLPVGEGLTSSLQAAADALAGRGSLSPLLRRHRVTEVLLLLAESGLVFQSAGVLSATERVRRVVAGRLHETWSAPVVAKALHLSTSALGRQVAKEGGTIASIVRELRLETALSLLQSTAWPVGDVALHCGYASHSRFGAAFKARFGFAPSLLREMA